MDVEFWHQKWEANEIGFHQSEVSPLLVKHFEKLNVPQGGRVFLPLCGKTKDIGWLLDQGYRVVGAELSELAITQLFQDLGLEPTVSREKNWIHYQAENIDIFVGDIFKLTLEAIGPVDAVYDRAALVALPKGTRNLYTVHLRRLTKHAPQLLICYEYDQDLAGGPPFSILPSEVKRQYAEDFKLRLTERKDVEGGAKGKCPATESVWVLVGV